MNQTIKQQVGSAAELRAVAHLRQRGVRIVGCNVHVGKDEIDVIGEDGDVVVFVEVRARKKLRDALESVTPKKQHRVCRAAVRYLGRRLNSRFLRFDVIAVHDEGLTHIVDAFRPPR